MLSSNFYNILSLRSFEIIKEIQKLGHNISLHFDLTIYKDTEKGFLKEKKIFEKIFNTKINIISFHRFGSLYKRKSYTKLNKSLISNCMHTYHNKFINDMTYISDSGGNKIQHKIDNILINKNLLKIHLLIHPIWWTSFKNNPTSVLDDWLKKNNKFLLSEIRNNCKTYER